MKTKLITALRAAATALENGTITYDWQRSAQCNCGILACVLTGKSVSDMRKSLASAVRGLDDPTWKNIIGANCPVTGMPVHVVLREMVSAGLTQQDIIHLENLSDPKVTSKMNVNPVISETRGMFGLFKKRTEIPVHYRWKPHAIAYMRTWADILTEEGKMDVSEKEESPQHA